MNCRNFDRTIDGRVFHRILDKVHKYLFHENIVDRHHGKVRRKAGPDCTIRKLAAKPVKCGTDDFLQGAQFLVQMDACFQSRDLHQVVQESIQPVRFVRYAFEKFIASVVVQPIPVRAQRCRRSRDG